MTFHRIMSLLAMAFLYTGSQIPIYIFGERRLAFVCSMCCWSDEAQAVFHHTSIGISVAQTDGSGLYVLSREPLTLHGVADLLRGACKSVGSRSCLPVRGLPLRSDGSTIPCLDRRRLPRSRHDRQFDSSHNERLHL